MTANLNRFVWAWAVLSCTQSAYAQNDPFALLFSDEDEIDASADDKPGDDDLRFLGIRIRNTKIKENVTAYERPDGLCIVTTELMKILEVPHTTNETSVSGWYIDEVRNFVIDYTSKKIMLSEHPHEVFEEGMTETPDGWCINAHIWSRFLPLDLTYDRSNLAIKIEPHEALPFEERWAREAIRAELDGKAPPSRPNYRDIPNPYRFLSLPVADLNISFEGSNTKGFSSNNSLALAGDIFFATGRVRTVSGVDGKVGVRGNLKRVFNGAKHIIPKQIEAGDISGLNQPFVTGTDVGRGVRITNSPTYTAEIFDMTDIRGDLPEGWEAELYKDGSLQAYVTEPNNLGEYVFEDVPIRGGYNRYTVKLYGPNGENDSRPVTIFAGSEMRPQNSFQYDVVALEAGKTLDGEVDEEHQKVGLASVSYGINRNLSTRLDVRVSEDEAPTTTISAFGALGETQGVIRYSKAPEYNYGVEVAAARRLSKSANIDARYRARSLRNNGGRNVVEGVSHEARIDLDAKLPLGRHGTPLRARIQYEHDSNSASRLQANARISNKFQGWRWSYRNAFSRTTSAEGVSNNQLNGNVSVTRRMRDFRLRSDLNFTLLSQPSLDSLNLSLQRRFSKRGVGQVSLAHDIPSNKQQLNLSFSRNMNKIAVSTSASISSDGAVQAGLTLSTATYFNRFKNRIDNALPGLTSSGAVQFNVYDDTDGNQTYNDGDTPVEGASFLVEQSLRKEATDKSGVLILPGISTYRDVNLEFQLSSLEDPFLHPTEIGRSVRLRPGQIVYNDVPLNMRGDVEANIQIKTNGNLSPVAGVEVQVLNQHNDVVAKSVSEYDGYVYIDGLPMGDLSLRIAPETLKSIQASANTSEFSLSRDNTSSGGHALTIEKISHQEEISP